MSLFDDFMARGARLRGVSVRQSKFRGHTTALWLGKVEFDRALELLRHAIRATRTIAP